ncbi:MAG: hypothetical protein MUF70_07820, partial [Myxococcota bacterium]|nr:hypothetical protein [Myxococcota bacterium]
MEISRLAVADAEDARVEEVDARNETCLESKSHLRDRARCDVLDSVSRRMRGLSGQLEPGDQFDHHPESHAEGIFV